MFTLGFRFSLWKKMCSKSLPSPSAHPASMLLSCSCLGFYPDFSCTDFNICKFVFLFCLLPLNCMFYIGPNKDVTWCYLIATEVRQSKAIVKLKLKLLKEVQILPGLDFFLLHGNIFKKPRRGLLVWLNSSHSSIPIHQWHRKGVL